jgi:hypothetical protein
MNDTKHSRVYQYSIGSSMLLTGGSILVTHLHTFSLEVSSIYRDYLNGDERNATFVACNTISYRCIGSGEPIVYLVQVQVRSTDNLTVRCKTIVTHLGIRQYGLHWYS